MDNHPFFWYTVSTPTKEDTMLRKRLITLLIETDEGRPEDWDWPSLIDASPLTTIQVVNVEEV